MVRDVASHTCIQATVTTTDDSAAAAKMLKQGKADVWIPDSRVRAILAGTALASAALASRRHLHEGAPTDIRRASDRAVIIRFHSQTRTEFD